MKKALELAMKILGEGRFRERKQQIRSSLGLAWGLSRVCAESGLREHEGAVEVSGKKTARAR